MRFVGNMTENLLMIHIYVTVGLNQSQDED